MYECALSISIFIALDIILLIGTAMNCSYSFNESMFCQYINSRDHNRVDQHSSIIMLVPFHTIML